jgi:hypothetical protein
MIVVRRYRIIRSPTVCYDAYTKSVLMGKHGSITSIEGYLHAWWGRLGTERNLPDAIEMLPSRSDERIAAVQAWQAANYERAYAAIIRAFPEATKGRRTMGTINLDDDTLSDATVQLEPETIAA